MNQSTLGKACDEGQYADLVKYYDEVLIHGGLDLDVAAHLNCLLMSLVEVSRIDDAVDLYIRSLKADAVDTAPWVISPPLRKNKLYDIDIELWGSWRTKNKTKVSGWIQHAKSLQLAGRLPESLNLIKESINYFPSNANIRTLLGMYLLQTGDYSSAVTEFRSALEMDPMQPAWVKRAISSLTYEQIMIRGVTLSVPVGVVSPGVLRYLVEGGYEGREADLLEKIIRSDDRVLELGAGLGFLACRAGNMYPDIKYCAIEANPNLIPVIKENFRLNNSAAEIHYGAAAVVDGKVEFHVADDFWASSLEDIHDVHNDISVPSIDIRPIIENIKPSLLVIDIEGGELDLLPELDLSTVDRVIIELHPLVYGNEGSSKVIGDLFEAGLHLDAINSGAQVFLFTRD